MMRVLTAVFLLTFLQIPVARSHTPDADELKYYEQLRQNEVQYDIQVIEGNWDVPNATPSPSPAAAAPKAKAATKNARVSRTSEPSKSLQKTETPAAVAVSVERPLFDVIRDYLVLGFEHILPEGTDHILFVLGLFLFSTSLRSLFLQISAFTLAHTVTLILSTLGVLTLSSSIVEPIIAASIVFVALENIFQSRLKGHRIILIFLFGLLHGMGFAGALAELGLPSSRLMPALLSFNVGVEFGQLSVVALAFAAVFAFRQAVWYRRYVVIPASLAIAAVGVFWTVTRIFPFGG